MSGRAGDERQGGRIEREGRMGGVVGKEGRCTCGRRLLVRCM